MADQNLIEEDILRRALFVPCHTKQDLHRWICIYLGINLPDTIVDPESNSSPMDVIWEIYEKAMSNDDPDFSRVMVYASRDSFKTLSAAILEVLFIVHLNRDVGHMAAIKAQAQKAQSYVKQMFRYPYLRDYVVSANTERTEIVWHTNPATGAVLTSEEYEALSQQDKRRFQDFSKYIKIVICSMQGSNADHVPFFVVDEVDVVPKQNQQAYQEAKSIPGIDQYGHEPITLLTSTRKFAFGNVQRELDNADKSGLIVRHWNIIDVTEACPPERHLPEEPRIPIFVRKEELAAIGEEDFHKLDPNEQENYVEKEGYSGCLKKCKLFAVCQGHLATRQKEHERDANGQYVEKPRPVLKSIRFTTNKFRELSLDMAKAQLMCWQASSEGLIYPYISKQKHLVKPHQVLERLLGEPHPESLGYTELLLTLKERHGRWIAGVDFGFTHMFSVVLAYVEGPLAYVVGRWAQPELDPAEKIDLLDRTIKEFNPKVYADTEAPDMIKFLKKHGYRCADWTKGPGSVLSGIETVRHKIMPTLTGEPQLFFVDGGNETGKLMDELMLYHWELGPDGKPTDQPDEIVTANPDTGEVVLDDSCDALRYLMMNTFQGRGKVMAAKEDAQLPTPGQVHASQNANVAQNRVWGQQVMESVLGSKDDDLFGDNEMGTEGKGKKGSFSWEIG